MFGNPGGIELPEEIVLKILTYLPTKDKAAVASSSKEMYIVTMGIFGHEIISTALCARFGRIARNSYKPNEKIKYYEELKNDMKKYLATYQDVPENIKNKIVAHINITDVMITQASSFHRQTHN